MDLAHRLAEYAADLRFNSLDLETVKAAKARLVDAMGCALGAFAAPPARIGRKLASSVKSSHSSTLLGTRTRTSPDLATFVNGTMIRYFDFNDTYLSKEPAHPSDNFAACLAVAEAVGAGGKELITAAVLAYEIQCRLCDAADIRHRGWDHVNYGLVSTALAASKLMHLDTHSSAEAVNIALNGHIALRQVRAGELSMWKGASFANASRNGVFAALLAQGGMTGPSPIFEGEMGFFNQVSGRFEMDVGNFGGRGGTFKVKETCIKYWPAEYHAQTAVWAAAELHGRVADPEEVESVLVETHEAGFTILAKDREKWRPSTKESADHSLPFMTAAALADGWVENATYSERKIRDTRLLRLVDKVKVVEDPRMTAVYPGGGMPNRVTVKLKNGSVLSKELGIPRGHPANPMTVQEVETKFARMARPRLGARGTRKALEVLWRAEQVDDAGELVKALAMPTR